MNHRLFHEHLDQCERCRTQPFNLCSIGLHKLQTDARIAEEALNRPRRADASTRSDR